MTLAAIVLAAGEGKRMKSAVPKVLHPLAGRPLLHYPLRAARDLGASTLVVVASPTSRDAIARYVAEAFPDTHVEVCVQESPRGTGDAARVGIQHLPQQATRALLLYADTPLLGMETLRELLDRTRAGDAPLGVLTCELDDPSGYGRILRDASCFVERIVEDRDLSGDAERAVREINAGVYIGDTQLLREALEQVQPNNAQGEYYLTDVVAIVRKSGGVIGVVGHPDALVGVNDRVQLVAAEQLMYRRIAERHGRAGVAVRGDACIEDSVRIEADVDIGPGVCLRGATHIADGVRIDVGCVVEDSRIGPGVVIKPYSVIVQSEVEAQAQIGPFAHLRPGSHIGLRARVGNFVETKKTRLGPDSKANHLAYLGDGDVGSGANIGAGTIFCNYDGFGKHVTTIKDRVFIGSDSQIVAPVTIGEGAYVATGTTVTRDVPPDALAISRPRQENKEGYGTRLRQRLERRAKK